MNRRRLLFTKQNKRKRTEEMETRVEAFGEEEPAEWPFSW